MSECILTRRMDAKHVDSSQPNLLGAIAPRRFGATNLLFLVHSPWHNSLLVRSFPCWSPSIVLITVNSEWISVTLSTFSASFAMSPCNAPNTADTYSRWLLVREIPPPNNQYNCDIQCIIWVPALSVVSVRYSGPLWDVAWSELPWHSCECMSGKRLERHLGHASLTAHSVQDSWCVRMWNHSLMDAHVV